MKVESAAALRELIDLCVEKRVAAVCVDGITLTFAPQAFIAVARPVEAPDPTRAAPRTAVAGWRPIAARPGSLRVRETEAVKPKRVKNG